MPEVIFPSNRVLKTSFLFSPTLLNHVFNCKKVCLVSYGNWNCRNYNAGPTSILYTVETSIKEPTFLGDSLLKDLIF